jgi:hypothetical protein
LNNLVTFENAKDILKDLEKSFWEIPFENSQFQTEMFVIASQQTPERAYRAIGLQMMTKLQAVQEAIYQEEENAIERDELQFKINDPSTDQFEKRRAELKLRQIENGGIFTEKLKHDLLVDLNCLYRNLQKFPKFTQEQFEQSERVHFEQRLLREATGLTGATLSLINMRDDFEALEKYKEQVASLPNPSTNDLLKLVGEMTNKITERQP